MPNLLERILNPKPRRYKPPPVPRPLSIIDLHEWLKWFRQIEPGMHEAENETTVMYTVPAGRIALIDHINIHVDNSTPAAHAHYWAVIRDANDRDLRYYHSTCPKNTTAGETFTIPTPGDYLMEGHDIALFSPAANVEVFGSFHGWEGTRVR